MNLNVRSIFLMSQAIGKASAELAYAEALAEDADDALSAGKGREADGLTRQLVESGRCAGRDLRAVAEVCREDLADVQLTTERAPGTDTGRVRLDRPLANGRLPSRSRRMRRCSSLMPLPARMVWNKRVSF